MTCMTAASAGSARNVTERILSSGAACARAKIPRSQKLRFQMWLVRPSFGEDASAAPDKPHVLCKPCLLRETPHDERCLFCCQITHSSRIVAAMGRSAPLRSKHGYPADPRCGARCCRFRSCEDRLSTEWGSSERAVRIVPRPGSYQRNTNPV